MPAALALGLLGAILVAPAHAQNQYPFQDPNLP